MHVSRAIYETKEIRQIERIAQEKFAISDDQMMKKAGLSAFEFLQHRWPNAKKIAVVCGNGRNGGDGLWLSQAAHHRGFCVSIFQVGDPERQHPLTRSAYEACLNDKLQVAPLTKNSDLTQYDVIVDAICGIGIKGALRREATDAIQVIQRASQPILALDIPTGIDADNGRVLGLAVSASATITFIGLKIGLLIGDGLSFAGQLEVDELGLPQAIFSSVNPVANVISYEQFAKKNLKPRPRNWHKGQSGHVLIIGGDVGLSGAAVMAGEAALRVGAGLVTIATHATHAPFLNLRCPELIVRAVEHPNELTPLVNVADVIVVGPGLGTKSWGKVLWQTICGIQKVLVVDADGLNLLAEQDYQRDNWVLTPHPGEAARLLNASVAEIQNDRLLSAAKLAERYGGCIILKGAGTIIKHQKDLPWVCTQGNPGMSTAGMGDVLSGILGGLIAQGIPLADAAALGVSIHAIAGDRAAQYGERGLIATDLYAHIHQLSNLSETNDEYSE